MDNKMEIDDDETMRIGISKADLYVCRKDALENIYNNLLDLEFELNKNAYELRHFLQSSAYKLEQIHRSRISAEKEKVRIQKSLDDNP